MNGTEISFLDIVGGGGGAAPVPAAEAPPAAPAASPEGSAPIAPTDDAPAASAFDETTYLSEITGGKYKSRDEVSQFLQRAESLEPEYLQLKEFKEKAYANEFVAGLNELVKNGASQKQIDLYYDLGKLDDVSKLSDYDALIKAELIQKGDQFTEDDIKFMIEDKFPKSAEELAEREGLTDEVAERRFRSMELQRKEAAIKAKEFLNQTRKSVFEVSSKPEELQRAQAAQEAKQKWEISTPMVSQLVGEKFTLSFSDEKSGTEANIEIPIPKDYLNSVLPQIPTYAAQMGIAPTAENLQVMKEEVIKGYVASNYQTILRSVYADAEAKATKRLVEAQGNPAKPQLPQQQMATATEKNDLAYIIR
jgi:hypothetical protein